MTSKHQPSATPGFWHDTKQRDAMLVDVLAALLRLGPLDDDYIARFCLTPQDLFALMPEDIKAANAKAMTEALINYLDGPMSINSFARSLSAWRESVRTSRSALEWSKLPPVTQRLAKCYASEITAYAMEQGWAIESDNPNAKGWRLTEQGMAALERLKKELR